MRVTIKGEVVKVADASWTNREGQLVQARDVFVRQDDADPAFGADRISYRPEPGKAEPQEGETAEFRVSVTSGLSRAGKDYLKVFCIDHKVVKAAPKLASVAG